MLSGQVGVLDVDADGVELLALLVRRASLFGRRGCVGHQNSCTWSCPKGLDHPCRLAVTDQAVPGGPRFPRRSVQVDHPPARRCTPNRDVGMTDVREVVS
jgi:hypothetical protein